MTLQRLLTEMAVGLVLLILAGAQANAGWSEVTKCGPLDGRAYYFSGGAVPQDKAGWHSDSISKGSTTLLTDGKDFDVIYKDAAQRNRSARFHDKATIISRNDRSSLAKLIIVYVYDASTTTYVSEQYTFQIDSRGSGILLLSQQKDGMVSKSSIMAANCSLDN